MHTILPWHFQTKVFLFQFHYHQLIVCSTKETSIEPFYRYFQETKTYCNKKRKRYQIKNPLQLTLCFNSLFDLVNAVSQSANLEMLKWHLYIFFTTYIEWF